MENFSYSSYADSGDSSPRSREIEFDSVAPPPWDQNYRAKFMCSYGGKILPRPHDNSLCYVGGETKILAVDRAIKLPTMVAKLSSLFGGVDDISFKYQLPGEDLDALISVTNDDDLELMMCEYDRLYRAAAKPARMRLFLFPAYGPRAGFAAEGLRADRDVFVEALNLGPNMAGIMAEAMANSKAPNTVDFLFGLEKYVTPSAPPAPPPIHAVVPAVSRADRSGPAVNRIDNFAGMYPTDNYYAAAAAAAAARAVPEKIPVNVSGAVSVPVSVGYFPERTIVSGGFPAAVTAAGVSEHPVYVIPSSGGVSAVFHPRVGRAVTPAQASQAAFGPPVLPPRSIPEVYWEKPVYGVIPPPPPPPPLSAAMPTKILPVSGAPAAVIPPFSAASPIIPPISSAVLPNIPPLSAAPPPPPPPPPPPAVPPYSASAPPVAAPPQMPKFSAAAYADSAAGIVRTSGGFAVATSDAVPYGPVGYEGATPRHVYYAAPGRVMVAPPVPALPHSFAPMAAVGAAAARGGGGLGLDGKLVVAKVPGPV